MSIIAYVLTYPYAIQETLSHLPPSAFEADRQAVAQSLQQDLGIRCMFLPVRLIVGWSSFALILFYACKAFGQAVPCRFDQVFSLEVHAEFTTVLAKFSTFAWINLRGTQDGASMQVPFSAAALVHPWNDFPAIALLNSLNIFILWYLVIVIVGVSVLTGFKTGKAFLVVLCVWSVSVLFNIAVLMFMRDGLHLVV